MRTLLAILASITVLSATAQTQLYYIPTAVPFTTIDYSNRALQLRPFAALNAGVIFFNGATTYVSAPMGLMLARPISNNWAAFASATVAPTVFSMNRLYSDQLQSPFGPNHYGVNVNAAVQAGLIYTNDAKTFSISGSVILERGSYPVYTPSNQTRPKSAY